MGGVLVWHILLQSNVDKHIAPSATQTILHLHTCTVQLTNTHLDTIRRINKIRLKHIDTCVYIYNTLDTLTPIYTYTHTSYTFIYSPARTLILFLSLTYIRSLSHTYTQSSCLSHPHTHTYNFFHHTCKHIYTPCARTNKRIDKTNLPHTHTYNLYTDIICTHTGTRLSKI